MENSSSDARNLASSAKKKVIEELVRGSEFAAQLKLVLHHQLITGTTDHEPVKAKHLITEVLRSFKEALSILSCAESCKDSSTLLPFQNQCGLKSQVRNTQETWTRITPVPIEDGYAWRKYGQKEILHAKHVRSYYRCSYRFDQGCYATKQVQKTEDEPPTFWTKYIGHHTCQDILKAKLKMDSTAEKGVLLSFELNTRNKRGPPSFSSSLPSSNEDHHKKSTSIRVERYKPKARARLHNTSK